VALCVSIFLDAIQRFFEPQEVTHPVLVLIVGSFGLASNIVGLALFHDHGHSHGHSHGTSEQPSNVSEAENGRSRLVKNGDNITTENIADEAGNISDVLPENRVRSWRPVDGPQSHSETNLGTPRTNSGGLHSSPSRRSHGRSKSRAYSNLEDLPIHPASFRNDIIAASRLEEAQSESDTDLEAETAVEDDAAAAPTEHTPLLNGTSKAASPRKGAHRQSHSDHLHNKPKDTGSKHGHGHGHGDLNMRGVFLHVLGDALGNIGVIATALFIWLTPYKWRFYSDPFVSLIITMIILTSAIPLCKAASRILLQAVPTGLDVQDIKNDISSLPGISGVHHLHVWQLSDTKLVASLHVRVQFDFKGEGSEDYMRLARQIRKCLHGYGIHSSTIQPEFCCETNPSHSGVREPGVEDESCREDDSSVGSSYGPKDNGCLLDCDDECGPSSKCCSGPADDAGTHPDDDH
jgi:zinc transporter 1